MMSEIQNQEKFPPARNDKDNFRKKLTLRSLPRINMQSPLKYRPNFFHINYLFLKYGGFWPPEQHPATTFDYKIYKIYQSIVLLFVLGFCSYSTARGIVENASRFTMLIEVSNVGATIFLAEIKIIFWLKNASRLKRLMNTLEHNEFLYEKIDDFDPEILLKESKNVGKIYSVTLLIFAELTLAFGYIPACTTSFWYYLNGRSIANVSGFESLPYYTHIPFEHDTAIKYFFACLLQYLPYQYIIVGFVCVDGLFQNLLNLIGENMRILRGAFRTLRRRCLRKVIGPVLAKDGLRNSEELETLMMLEMKKCIQHLQMLFSSCNQIEDIFKFLCLSQAFATLYILCSTLLLLSTTSILEKEFGKNFFYLTGAAIQLGLYCWSGNELTLKTANVASGLWEGDWFEARKPFKTCMIITLMRLQRPLVLTAGKFAPLAVGTQISVLKGSYSYYTLLKTMSNK